MLKGKLGNMTKQAQKMQQDMAKVQEELGNLLITGESASGKVKVTVSCSNIVKMVDIDPSLNTGEEEELELLQDLIKIATNDALSKAKKISDDKLGAVTAGLSLPGM